MSHTRKSVFNLFLELEAKHGLWKLKTHWGIYYWKVIRFRLFMSVLKQLGIVDEAQKTDSITSKRKKPPWRNSWNSVLLFRKKVDAILLEFPRKVKKDNQYIDPYTGPLAEDLASEGISFIRVEEGSFGHQNPSTKGRRYVGESFFEGRIKRAIMKKGNPVDEQTEIKINEVLRELSTALDRKIEFRDLRSRLIRFELQKRVWEKVFRRTKCKDIYLVCAYGQEGIVSAAQEAGVRVTELQHGQINRYHPGYSYGSKEIPYFPDRLFLYGRKWCGPFLPIDHRNCIITGYKFLNDYTKKAADPAIKHGVVFLSQMSINERLLEYALELNKLHPEIEIIFKFHPREKKSIVEKARERCPSIQFIINEKSLYEILSEVRFAVGVFSTTVFEALAFGCKVLLANAPGIEMLEEMVGDLALPICSNARELADILTAENEDRPQQYLIDEWFYGCKT